MFTKSESTYAFWYYVLGCVNLALVIDLVIANAISRSSSSAILVARGASVVAVAIVACGIMRGWARAEGLDVNPFNFAALTHTTESSRLRWQEIVALWINQNLPADARVFVYDYPGYIAYRSRAAIISCDGLESDYNYNKEIVSEGIANYLARHHINYYFGPSASPGQEIDTLCSRVVGKQDWEDVYVFAPLTDQSAQSFRVCRNSKLMQLDRLLGHRTDPAEISLFRLEPRGVPCEDNSGTDAGR